LSIRSVIEITAPQAVPLFNGPSRLAGFGSQRPPRAGPPAKRDSCLGSARRFSMECRRAART
jgi:hypothetical protein